MKTILFKKSLWFTVIMTSCLVLVTLFAAVSCDKSDILPKTDTDVSFTPCQPSKLRSSGLSDKVDVEFTNKGVQITHYDFEVTCDFTTVNVSHTLVNGVLDISQQGTPNQADCICYTDVSYTIDGILQNEVNVIFINGAQVYCYNDNTLAKVNLGGSKWKLIGIVDVQTGDLAELEPKDCDECYTIAFNTDNTFEGRTTSNIIMGNYEIDYSTHNLRFANIGGTEVGEVGEGYKYAEILWKIQSFTTKDTYLNLYYNDNKNYLKYKKTGG